MSDPAIPPAIPAEPKWLGPYKSADEALDELRRSVAEIIGSDPETWPSHGNAPLAIASALALATPPAPATTVEMLDRIIASAEAMTRPMLLDWLRHERAALATPPTPAATDEEVARMVERLNDGLAGTTSEAEADALMASAADLLARVARDRDDLERSWRMRGERCDEAETRATVAEAAPEKAKEALHRISLGSQDSGTTKEALGREARAALAAMEAGDGAKHAGGSNG